MARILGIDYGTRRTGLAATDPLQIIVNPLTVLPTEEILPFLETYCKQEEVEKIVCGIPGEQFIETRKAIQAFVRALKKVLPEMPVVFQDESLTSQRASGIILQSGLRRMQRRDKRLVDQVSAVLILQEYLGHLNDVY